MDAFLAGYLDGEEFSLNKPFAYCRNCDAKILYDEVDCAYCCTPVSMIQIACREDREKELQELVLKDNRTDPALPSPLFTLFNGLPGEIRRLIWKQALPGPRIVHVDVDLLAHMACSRVWSDKDVQAETNDFFDVQWNADMPCAQRYGFRTKSLPPNLIYVCKESLAVTKQFYTRAFGSSNALADVWFDFSLDTLYLDVSGEYFMAELLVYGSIVEPHLVMRDMPLVQNLALLLPFPRLHNYSERVVLKVLQKFTAVKNLSIVAKRHHAWDTEDLVFMDIMDFDSAVGTYKQSYSLEKEMELRDRHLGHAQDLRFSFQINMPIYKTLRLEYYHHDPDHDLYLYASLPLIKHRIITTAWTKAAVEKAKFVYERKCAKKARRNKRRGIVEFVLQDRHGRQVMFTVRAISNIRECFELIELHCLELWNEDLSIKHLCQNGELLELGNTWFEAGIRHGDVLDVYFE